MKFQMCQPIESTSQLSPDGNSMSPLKCGCTIPRKSARPRNARKSWQHFEHLRASTAAGRYEEGALHKARVRTNRPRVQRRIIRVHIIMTAANFSPAVASHGAKYDDNFRVPTLLDAQPLDLAARVRQRTTHNVDMAIEPEEGGKLAHERLQSALPVRAKTRRHTTTPGGTPGLLCRSNPLADCQRTFSHYSSIATTTPEYSAGLATSRACP